jgi:hypothetical protein
MTDKQIKVTPLSLVSWIESQPELLYLKEEAAKTQCKFTPSTGKLETSVDPSSDRIVDNFQNPLWKRVIDMTGAWVLPRSLRGKSYSSQSFDQQVKTTANIVSFANLWDFIFLIPILRLMGVNLLGGASWIAAIFISYVLLAIDSKSSERACNRVGDKRNGANAALLLFIVLSLIRTAFSGVGFDLIVGRQGIAQEYAARLAREKLRTDEAEIKNLSTQKSAQLKSYEAKCSQYKQELTGLERTNPKFETLYVLAYGQFKEVEANKLLTTKQILDKYGGSTAKMPVCTAETIQIELDNKRLQSLNEKITQDTIDISKLEPITYLQKRQPEIFNAHFKKINPENPQEIDFIDGLEGVREATKHFYDRFLTFKWTDLGISIFILAVSLILCIASVYLLHAISRQKEMMASSDEELQLLKQDILDAYRQILPEAQEARREKTFSKKKQAE